MHFYRRLYLLPENRVDFTRLRRAIYLSNRQLDHFSRWRIQHIPDQPDQIWISGCGTSFHEGRQTCVYVLVVVAYDAVWLLEIVSAVNGLGRQGMADDTRSDDIIMG